MNQITMKLNADKLIMMALQEDITSEDVSTNAVMPKAQKGKVDLICKQDGIICGLPIFARVFTLLDENTVVDLKVKDGDKVARSEFINGNLRLVLSVIQRFSNRGENPDDLFQVGCIGLIYR